MVRVPPLSEIPLGLYQDELPPKSILQEIFHKDGSCFVLSPHPSTTVEQTGSVLMLEMRTMCMLLRFGLTTEVYVSDILPSGMLTHKSGCGGVCTHCFLS